MAGSNFKAPQNADEDRAFDDAVQSAMTAVVMKAGGKLRLTANEMKRGDFMLLMLEVDEDGNLELRVESPAGGAIN